MSNTRNLGDIGRNTALKGLGGDNLIINGNFDIWQRGTSGAAGYVADRWVHFVAGPSGTVTQSRQAFTTGQTDVPNNPRYFYRIQGSSYTLTAGNLTQKIEDVRTLAGETVTVSFYAKASAARQIQIRFYRVFGVGGSASDSTIFSAVSLTTSWQKFVVTGNLPSVSGKTIGDGSSIQLAFDIKEGAFGSDLNSDSIDIAQVKLEPGDTATDFVPRRIEDELAKCQRYYEKLGHIIYGGYNVNANFAGASWIFNTEKRVNPTITFGAGQTGILIVSSVSGVTTLNAASSTAMVAVNTTADAEL